MRILVALGGNALLRRAEPLTAANQLANIRAAARQIAKIAGGNQLIVAHGNGPQVGLLALQAAAPGVPGSMPLDVLDAESEGMIGYLLEQQLANALPPDRAVATLLTRVEVDAADPAFQHPTKPIGPLYSHEEARSLAAREGWQIAPDGAGSRRVVPSPRPLRFVEPQPLRWLLEHDAVVIAAGGGGIPIVRDADGGACSGVEAVIDKDLASALLARELDADLLVIATDVDAVYLDWRTPQQRALSNASAAQLREKLSKAAFAAGSMEPKVAAACEFAEQTGRAAVIGSLERIDDMVAARAGTRITR
ncbi:carbamate kinase [Paraburkholderia solisilvae]|uniref:Carbamate kinase n=1 Tax=Paraburkholderia solisilvae TaxID=624376 RepID=A0A6J5D9Z6_9BURK|nr:carbamate kinase [Paraburkholderia solisilvae]CAB3751110.1 Carbamate kinase 1 [Paraburkholderia solisilvae]